MGTLSPNYASPTSGEAYRDWRLTTNFELWVEIFCVPTCFHMRIPKPCLSVRLSFCLSVCLSAPREKKSSKFRQYQSYEYYTMEIQKFNFFQKSSKFEFWLLTSISVLHWQLIHQWKGLHEYYTMITRKFEKKIQKSSKFKFWLLTKSWNHLSFVSISPTLVIDTSMERSSRVLHHGNPIFSQKSSKFEFWLLTKSWNHLTFVNISLTLVIDTSMERSSRVLRHGNPKIWFFLQKSSKFDFWRRAKISP